MEIRAARYFDGFDTKTQKEQLELINDSRTQIEELVGELTSILNQKESTVPAEIKERFDIHIQELKSDNLFSKLSGLKRILGSLLLLDTDDKTISEFTERNKDYITEYIQELSKVDVTRYAFTTSQYEEWMMELQKNMPSPSMMKAAHEMATYKPFAEYERLVVNCINKIAKNEKKGFFSEDFSFTEDEVLDKSKWFLRVRKSKNAAVWLLTYETLLSFIKDIHDKRVAQAKAEVAK